MVAAEAVQKDDCRAGPDALVIEREFSDLQSARGDSIFHDTALFAPRELIKSLILSAALAPQTISARTLTKARPALDRIAIKSKGREMGSAFQTRCPGRCASLSQA